MSKAQNNVKLTGIILDPKHNWVPAKTHQANDVLFFQGEDPKVGTFFINHKEEGTPILRTSKGEYPLIWNKAGYFEPKQPVPGVKIHVILKKITGKLIYWA